MRKMMNMLVMEAEAEEVEAAEVIEVEEVTEEGVGEEEENTITRKKKNQK